MGKMYTFTFEKLPWSTDYDYIVYRWTSRGTGETGRIKILKYVTVSPSVVEYDQPGVSSREQIMDELDAFLVIEKLSEP